MSYEVSQNFELVSHEKGKAYPISVKEWEVLKDQVSRIQDRTNGLHTAGSILLGAAGSAVLNGLTATFPAAPPGSKWSIPELVNWFYAGTTGVCGILSFWFGHTQKTLQIQLAQDVVKQMELIEGRFQKEKSSQLGSARAIAYYHTVVNLKHVSTGKLLASCPKNYSHPGTSGQQMVFAVDATSPETSWLVKGPHGQPEDYHRGESIQNDDIIRLEHISTRKNLHSHNHRSPISKQQEVTAIGDNGVCDSNDNWKIEVDGGGMWLPGKLVRFVHVNTNKTLHSHAMSQQGLLEGNQEITCFDDGTNQQWWEADF